MKQARYISKTVEGRRWYEDEWENLNHCLGQYRFNRQTIVLACGCFDLLHVGHVRMLQEAADLGDILVVGVNSDESVRYLKGETRPIIRESQRMEMVASLEGVNFVTIFHEDDPRELIKLVRPNIYVKGGEYLNQRLLEHATVTENGGEVYFTINHSGYSTTALLSHIRGLLE